MWFNSFGFWIFYLVVLGGYVFLGHRGRNWLLLVASYFFYGCWDWRFLGLIGFVTVSNYVAALGIAGAATPAVKRRWLFWSSVVSLGVLGLFKYFNFFTHELDRLLETVGLPAWDPGFRILLPAGISFYTFQGLSYTVDVFRGVTPATRNFVDFALYKAFFPQLVAGPIERSNHLLPQVQNPRPRLDETRFREGLYHVLFGLFKKVVVADNMAWIANHAFRGDPSQLTPVEVLVGVYAFAFQIYGDFSGYSSIAVGVGKWLGFDLMDNFRQPYFATNPSAFWRRWHISLSTWLRDYLYIPLGGNRSGPIGTYRNLLITMVLGGLWHGAAWTFVFWGLLHGLWLAVHRFATEKQGRRGAGAVGTPPAGPWVLARRALALLGTFHMVCLSWLFFRADSFSQAWAMLGAFGRSWQLTDYAAMGASLIVFFAGPWMLFEYWVERRGDLLALTKIAWPWRVAAYAFMIFMLVFFPPPMASEFIYFQF